MNPNNDHPQVQLKDGRWVNAQPIPYYKDSRSFFVKIWHTLITIRNIFVINKSKREFLENKLEKTIDSYLIPVEPYTDKHGKWHKW